VVQPLPTNHLIFRAPNAAAGKCWMDALELALRCSSLLLRTMGKGGATGAGAGVSSQPFVAPISEVDVSADNILSESDLEGKSGKWKIRLFWL